MEGAEFLESTSRAFDFFQSMSNGKEQTAANLPREKRQKLTSFPSSTRARSYGENLMA